VRLCADRHVLRVYAESCWWLLVVAGMCVCVLMLSLRSRAFCDEIWEGLESRENS
jgi:hypothetical protein